MDPVNLKEIFEYFEAGFSLAEIAKAFNLTRQQSIKHLSIYLNQKHHV